MEAIERVKCRKLIKLFDKVINNTANFSVAEDVKYGFVILDGISKNKKCFSAANICTNAVDLYKELFRTQQIEIFDSLYDEDMADDVFDEIFNYIENGTSEEKILLKYLTEEQLKIFNCYRSYYFIKSQKILNSSLPVIKNYVGGY